MKWKDIFTVYRKELKDALRDRRTLISTFVIPAFVMPALMFGFGTASHKAYQTVQAEIPSVMIIGGANAPELRQACESDGKLKIVPTMEDYAAQITAKKLRAAVEIPANFGESLRSDKLGLVKIYHYRGEFKSEHAVTELKRVLQDYRDKSVQQQVKALALPSNFVKPFGVTLQNVAPPEKVGGNLAGGIIPYMLILLCFTGAIHTAMDLTAGEKERGTMETILCSPVARMDIVLGKFLMVLTASLATVTVTLTSFSVTALASGLMPTLSTIGVLAVFVMVLPLAVFFSALLLTVALFAKNFKEAQTYVSPLVFLVIVPAAIGLLPEVELNTTYAFIPILNVTLLSKEMVSGNFPLQAMALIFGSTCIYAFLALKVATYMFNREDVIFRT
jgi:sodium transport system permease protein